MSDETRFYSERLGAAHALIEDRSQQLPWVEIIERFRVGNNDSTRLAVELISKLGPSAFEPHQIAKCVLAETGFEHSDKRRRTRSGTGGLWKLRTGVATEAIGEILDEIAQSLASYSKEESDSDERWESWYELASFTRNLISRALKESPPATDRLWRWLESFASNDYFNQRDIQEIDRFLRENTDFRLGVLRAAVKSRSVQKNGSFFRVKHIAPGLSPSPSDIEILSSELIVRGLNTPEDRQILKALYGEAFHTEDLRLRLLPQFQKLAAHDDELLAFLDPKPSESEKAWRAEEKKIEESQRRRKLSEERKRIETREKFTAHLQQVELGELKWISPPAKGYLGFFSDIDNQLLPFDRLVEWLGTDVASACLKGFEAVLHRSDLPSPQEVSRSYVNGKFWHIIHPVICGLAERTRTSAGFSGVPYSVLKTGWYGILGELLDHLDIAEDLTADLLQELGADSNKFEEAIRGWFEPHLAAHKEYIPGLYAFLREQRFEAIAWKLALDWLQNYPSLPYSSVVDLISTAVHPPEPVRIESWRRLKQLTVSRAESDPTSDETFTLWSAVKFIVDFELFARTLATSNGAHKNLLWEIRRVTSFDRASSTIRVELTSEQLAWLVSNFRSYWPKVYHPSGVTSGDRNPWDASQFVETAISQLARRTEPKDMEILSELCRVDDSYSTLIRAAIADQKRLLIEKRFRSPSIDSIKHAISNAPPTNSAELQSVVVAEFEALQRRVHGDSDDTIDLFYTDEGKPRNEDLCLKRALQNLKLPFGIKYHHEEAMPRGKRADAGFHFGNYRLPLEAKGQWNSDVWTAAEEQLNSLYSIDHLADSRGIYVVFWFGRKAPPGRRLRLPPGDRTGPKTALEMKELIERRLPSGLKDLIAIFVLDLERTKTKSDV